jgi:hypothetical protein
MKKQNKKLKKDNQEENHERSPSICPLKTTTAIRPKTVD